MNPRQEPGDINSAFGFARLGGPENLTLGSFITKILPIIFAIASLMVVFYFIIGAFELITSQGDKAHIVSARSKIYHSIIGFILLIAMFLVVQYIIPTILGDPITSFGII